MELEERLARIEQHLGLDKAESGKLHPALDSNVRTLFVDEHQYGGGLDESFKLAVVEQNGESFPCLLNGDQSLSANPVCDAMDLDDKVLKYLFWHYLDHLVSNGTI